MNRAQTIEDILRENLDVEEGEIEENIKIEQSEKSKTEKVKNLLSSLADILNEI